MDGPSAFPGGSSLPPLPPPSISPSSNQHAAPSPVVLGAAASSQMRQTALGSNSGRIHGNTLAIPNTPGSAVQHQVVRRAPEPLSITSGLAIAPLPIPPPPQSVEEEVSLPETSKVVRDEEAEQLQELTGKHFLKGVLAQEDFEENVRKCKWFCAVFVWVATIITLFIIAIALWDAVRTAEVYYLDEMPGICEDMYTFTGSGCSVQIWIRECYKPKRKPKDADCSRLNAPDIVYEDRSMRSCEWSTSLFGRYSCWYQRDDHGTIRVDTLAREQSTQMFPTTVAFGVIVTTFLLCFIAALTWYSRRAWSEWQEFACEPWNRFEE